MDDKIEPKTEHSFPAKTEPKDDELTLPLTSTETLCPIDNTIVLNGEQSSISEFSNTNNFNVQQHTKDKIVTSSQYISAQSTISDISESN